MQKSSDWHSYCLLTFLIGRTIYLGDTYVCGFGYPSQNQEYFLGICAKLKKIGDIDVNCV